MASTSPSHSTVSRGSSTLGTLGGSWRNPPTPCPHRLAITRRPWRRAQRWTARPMWRSGPPARAAAVASRWASGWRRGAGGDGGLAAHRGAGAGVGPIAVELGRDVDVDQVAAAQHAHGEGMPWAASSLTLTQVAAGKPTASWGAERAPWAGGRGGRRRRARWWPPRAPPPPAWRHGPRPPPARPAAAPRGRRRRRWSWAWTYRGMTTVSRGEAIADVSVRQPPPPTVPLLGSPRRRRHNGTDDRTTARRSPRRRRRAGRRHQAGRGARRSGQDRGAGHHPGGRRRGVGRLRPQEARDVRAGGVVSHHIERMPATAPRPTCWRRSSGSTPTPGSTPT